MGDMRDRREVCSKEMRTCRSGCMLNDVRPHMVYTPIWYTRTRYTYEHMYSHEMEGVSCTNDTLRIKAPHKRYRMLRGSVV